MEDYVKQKLSLNQGETVKLTGHKMKGSLQETDLYSYDILDSNGQKAGTVEYTHHTAIKSFRVTQSVTQKTLDGVTVVNDTW
ncbi:MAG: hypothetical protein ABNH03_14575 [Alteromonas sp.]|jgi:hypothetical protein|uniref:hypothetical protein n=1 Tax=Alteromonas sp. TaxID=232 RepID=UPI000B669DA1|nr:hypothetical protein [Pseudoalteromonas sp.]OUX83948.1 MAG: hypothetical protein CBB95_17340 [Alteromonas sp. TMED35]|tara:strand:- start:10344 stop:10589 length:246 start_codon:yes stop_codon:yes gene_type:complete